MRTILLLVVYLLSFPPLLYSTPEENIIMPPRELTVKGNSKEQPPWMQIWESARTFRRKGEMDLARNSYRKLFQQKPDIEEALREYVLVLIHLQEWTEGSSVVQKLLEIDPASLEYQLYAGRIALQQKRYEQAASSFGQLYTLSPDGPYSIEALQGLVLSLQKIQKKELVYPLMEQLYLRVPHAPEFVRKLARYSVELGYSKKARDFYQTLFLEFTGTDQDFLQASALFEEAGDLKMAVFCWQEYLKKHSYHLPFHKKLSHYYLSIGQERAALSHLLVQLAHNDKSPELLLTIGKIYLFQEGRPDKALYYYEEYRKQRPSDDEVIAEIKRIQTVLAGDFLVIVENEGAWPLWRDLARITPDRLAIYSSMALQLEKLGKTFELREVLEIIHLHDPHNQEVIFKLAKLYFAENNFSASSKMLDALLDDTLKGKEYFLLRAKVEEVHGSSAQALDYYRHYLDLSPGDSTVLLRCLNIAGNAGLIAELEYYYGLLVFYFPDGAVRTEGEQIYGNALLMNGLPSMARQFFQTLQVKQLSLTEKKKQYQRKTISALQAERDFFAAEEKLREALPYEELKYPLVVALIDNNLQARDWDNAWKWYAVLVQISEKPDNPCDPLAVQLFQEKLKIFEQSSQLPVSLELLEDFLSTYRESCGMENQQWFELNGKLAELYYKNGNYADSLELFKSYPALLSENYRLELLQQLTRDRLVADDTFPNLLQIIHAKKEKFLDFPLDAILFLQELGEYQGALFLLQKYSESFKNPLRRQVVNAQLLLQADDPFASLQMYQELHEQYPNEKSFVRFIIELQFQLAKFDDVLEEIAPTWRQKEFSGAFLTGKSLPSPIQEMKNWQQLLLARTLWALGRRNDSLLVYESILEPPVDQLFSDMISRQNIEIILPPPKRSFLNRITFTNPAEPDRLTVVMSPEFTSNYFDKAVVVLATQLYEKFCWQDLVSRELSVRRAMCEGTYYQAMKEYQNLMGEDSSSESIFDLAGVYSRLGFLGKEAALYEKLKIRSPGYPHLDEALQRNILKRKPRAAVIADSMKKTGRHGYYDNNQLAGGVQNWFMPSLRHEVTLDYRRLQNKSVENEEELLRNRVLTQVKWSPVYDFDVLVGAGLDRTDRVSGTNFLYTLLLNGRIGDMFQGHIGLAQDIVDDTVAAIQQQIYTNEFETGITVDFLPRLFAGAGYLFTEYSDGNHQNRYDVWTTYILHGEPNLLQIRYGYEISHNADSNQERNSSSGSGFSPDDHPYWSPKEYWQHLFTVSFEHQLADDILGRGAPSYYSLEYSFGYERGGYGNHLLNADIFLEISRHFLLNSRLEYMNGAEFEKQDILFSLIYRW